MAGPIYTEREMIKAKSFRSLSGTAHVVLMDFLAKRQFCRRPNSNGKKEFLISNNGEIQYSYKEAEKAGITRPAFVRALDMLIERGFIEIAHHGAGGRKGDVNLYSVIDKWRKWEVGQKVNSRPNDTRRGVGFALIHSRKKEIIGNGNVTPGSNANVTPIPSNQ